VDEIDAQRCRFCGKAATRYILWQGSDGQLTDSDVRFPSPFV
jgi:hypothetical protein